MLLVHWLIGWDFCEISSWERGREFLSARSKSGLQSIGRNLGRYSCIVDEQKTPFHGAPTPNLPHAAELTTLGASSDAESVLRSNKLTLCPLLLSLCILSGSQVSWRRTSAASISLVSAPLPARAQNCQCSRPEIWFTHFNSKVSFLFLKAI